MKLALCLWLFTILAVVAVAARPTFDLKPLDWTAATVTYDILTTVAAKKDLLVYFTILDRTYSGVEVRRLNAQGEYVKVAFINATETTPLLWMTNGKWMAGSDTNPGVFLYSIDENNVLSSESAINAVGGNILSDDTFVGLDPTEQNDGSYTIRTWEYDALISNWTEVANTALNVPTIASYLGDASSYRVSDTHLVFNDFSNRPNNCTILIYERNADKSWEFLEKVKYNCTFSGMFPASPTYNGVDTLVVGNGLGSPDGNYLGVVFVYTKQNGVWKEQMLTPRALGYRPIGYIGLSVLFLDPDTLLVSVLGDGYTYDYNPSAGIVLMLTRDENGLWKDTLDLDNGASGFFGNSMGMNDNQLLITSITFDGEISNMTYYTAPLCFYKPVNATCIDVQLNDCSDIDVTTLYTINNPECGDVNVDVSAINLNVAANKLEATVVFTKELGIGAPVTCTASITCPAPPVTIVPVGAPTARTSSSSSTALISAIIFIAMLLSQ